MPPITAATIATIAIGAGRSRTDRTVAARVLDLSAENSLELCATLLAEPRSQEVGGAQRVLALGHPHPDKSSSKSVWVWLAECEEAWTVADLLRPWLSTERRVQLERVFRAEA